MGKLKDHTVKLNIDGKVIPIAQPQRRITFHVRDKMKDVIEKLEKEGMIKSQPTPWVSPAVVVPKSDGTVRLCVDGRMANQAIQRVRLSFNPHSGGLSLDLDQAKYFTELNLFQAYHQLPLDEQSRLITNFSTHLSLFRYTRLPDGVNAAAETFQYTLQQQLHGIDGVHNIANDFIILVLRNSSMIQPLNNVSNVYQTRV